VRDTGFSIPGRYACITVSDTGSGMDAETCARIFEPFFTTKEVGKGTGLGMAIVYGIVRQHNGFINVYSEPDVGTTFRVYLPAAEDEPHDHDNEEMPAAPRMGSETILLAEDDASVRKLVFTILTQFGYDVIQAEDGQNAVDLFATNRNRISLILMDMIMPKKNGKEAYAEICQLKPGVKILYCSGYTAEFMKNRGVSEDEIELIMKPVQPMELLRKIRGMLDE
jgi:polar amino acid transport system substrate-binding protein